MPNFSGNQKKTSSDSKRHFRVVIGSKEHGLYISSTPSSAAKKVAKKLCTSNKGKKVEFSLREITQGSKKKVYGPYIGYIEKLKDSGKIVVKNKKLSKKGGMKGGEGLDDIQVSIGKCGRRKKFSFTNPLKKCIVLSYNNRKITINYDAGKIIVKYFNNIDTNIYYKKIDYSVTKTDLPIFSIIIRELLNDQEVFLDQSRFLSLIIRINKFIKEIPNTDLKFSMINGWLDHILLTIPPQPIIPDIKPKPNKYQENLETQRKYQEKLNLIRIDPIIAKEKAENDRQRMIKAIQFIDQMNPNSEQGSALQHRTNWSKQSNYKSFTIQQQNRNQFSNNI